MDVQRQKQLLTLLADAQQTIAKGEELSTELARILFPPARKEYELTYFGKESAQSIISQTFAAPIQLDRSFGDADEQGWINKIIFGDNLQVLKTLVEWKKLGKLKNADGTDGVRLVYIDPPFATKSDFTNKDQRAYADKMKGAEFLEWLRKRLIMLREVMADNGSIYVHLDWHKAHYVKVLMDEIFGEGNFKNEIIWQRSKTVGRMAAKDQKRFDIVTDSIFWYGSSQSKVNKQYVFREYTFDEAKYKKFKYDSGKQNFYKDSPKGNYSDETISLLDKEGRVHWTRNGNPRILTYLKKENNLFKEKIEVSNLWNDLSDSMHISNKEKTYYPTQKPEDLLKRLISSGSEQGDLVLDLFGGSGTTAAVAEKLGRRWITGDVGKLAIYTMQKRILNIENHQVFAVYNAGHYDESKLNTFATDEWKKFAMALYDVEPQNKKIKGFDFDGLKDGEFVKVYDPQAQEFKDGAQITEDTLINIYGRLGSALGSEVFIIAPQGKFGFASDEYDHDGQWDTIFNILRVPYSMMQRFTEQFSALQQADDNSSVNDAIDSVGFDFIRPPKVDYELAESMLTIKSFASESRIKDAYKMHGFEAFSMLLIDTNYNGSTFSLTDVYFNKDFDDKQSIKLKYLNKHGKMMLIFIDKFGNEFKTEQEIK